ncbi:hypothetical protein DFH29DRAFT_917805 [Suillus ampliporus]|nr:hypothetical protein DFH29DRAFT_917805 [Suillus ampliporus]
MSLATIVVDDKSPLIQYDSGFNPGVAADDPSADRYFRGTFQRSSTVGSVATFSFNGTAVWIYGAKRSNHGNYTVTLDNASSVYNGEANPDEFQQVLFTQSGLTQGPHTVSLTNTGPTAGSWFDIDMVAWQTEFTGTQLVTEAIDDTDSRFQYQNAAWNTNPTSAILNLFNNGTGHSTSVVDATVTLTFTAESVSIFGTVGPNNGLYSVSLDSGQATQYNATAYINLYEVVLYHTDNLGSGQHQLTLTNLPEGNGQTLNIDYALLTSSSSSNSSSSSGSSTTSGSSTVYVTAKSLSSGAVAGIAVAVAVALLALAAAFFFYRRWKSAQAASQDLYRVDTPRNLLENSNAGASTSVETRSNASLIRQDTSSQGTSWRSYQQPDHENQISPRSGSRHVPSSGMPTVSETVSLPTQSSVDEPGGSRRPLPEAPGTRQNIFQQPVPDDSLGISKASAVQHRASTQSISPTIGDIAPPPNYMQATR